MTEARGRTPATPGLGNRLGPPRFLAFLITFPLAVWGYRAVLPESEAFDAVAMGFDLAALLFIASLWPLFADSTPDHIAAHSRDNDANRWLVLVLTTLTTIAVMVAIAFQLPLAKGGDPIAAAKLVGTLLTVWLFANLVYALHYAHCYYAVDPASGAMARGLQFKGDAPPDYRDFAYFAFTLGMTFQTSDVDIRTPALRRVVLLHSFAAFVFNIGVIAFTINGIGGAASPDTAADKTAPSRVAVQHEAS